MAKWDRESAHVLWGLLFFFFFQGHEADKVTFLFTPVNNANKIV